MKSTTRSLSSSVATTKTTPVSPMTGVCASLSLSTSTGLRRSSVPSASRRRSSRCTRVQSRSGRFWMTKPSIAIRLSCCRQQCRLHYLKSLRCIVKSMTSTTLGQSIMRTLDFGAMILCRPTVPISILTSSKSTERKDASTSSKGTNSLSNSHEQPRTPCNEENVYVSTSRAFILVSVSLPATI